MTKAVYGKMLLSKDLGVTDEDQHIVEGIVTDGLIDIDGHIIDPEGFKEAMADYLEWGNIRDQHGLPVAKVIEILDWNKFAVQVVDENVWKKIKAGLYKGFSVGIRVLDVVVDDVSKYTAESFAGVPRVMAESIKEGGFVFRITKMLLAEVSIVDRPANPRARITSIKSMNLDNDVHYLPSITKSVVTKGLQGEIIMDEQKDVSENTEVVAETPVIDNTSEAVVDDKGEEIQRLESKVASLEKSVDEFANNLSSLNGNLTHMEGKLATIDESLNKLITQLTEKTASVSETDPATETVEQAVEEAIAEDQTKSLEVLVQKMFGEMQESISKSIAESVESAVKKATSETESGRVGGVNLGEPDEQHQTAKKNVSNKTKSQQIAEKLVGMATRNNN